MTKVLLAIDSEKLNDKSVDYIGFFNIRDVHVEEAKADAQKIVEALLKETEQKQLSKFKIDVLDLYIGNIDSKQLRDKYWEEKYKGVE
jgi:hypothetical protein